MSELAIITLHLRPTHRATLPSWLGRSAQAWYLSQLQHVDPALSQAVHDGSRLRPFTLSTLFPISQGDKLELYPDRPVRLRVTTLHVDVTRLTLNGLVPHWLSDGIDLHGQHLRVESIDTETTSFVGLLDTASVQQQPRRQTLAFHSPTVFNRTGGLQVPLPLPEYVFGSLIDRWTAFAPIPLDEGLRAFVNEQVAVVDFEGRTRTISLERANRGQHIGFTGRATFHARSGEQPYLMQWHALGLFAAFSGVGKHSTIGLGQVKKLIQSHSQPVEMS
ncbi:MAG: CRISPR system precrRNA processing endoribonuclease RAMP protein Cas6 [Anaerolinea sp.]|nr:CRISPR system precrRNA processing endoribonuclease RAMP protein Cas6 [Anaerolinea sp.]